MVTLGREGAQLAGFGESGEPRGARGAPGRDCDTHSKEVI